MPSIKMSFTPLRVFGDSNSASHIPSPRRFIVASAFSLSRLINAFELKEQLRLFCLFSVLFIGVEHDAKQNIINTAKKDVNNFFIIKSPLIIILNYKRPLFKFH